MRFSKHQVISVNVNNVTANCLGWAQGQGQVLMFGVKSQVFLVDGSLINGIGTRVVNKFAEQNSIYDLVVKIFTLSINWQ